MSELEVAMTDAKDRSETDTAGAPFRIWALHCPFKKDGFPSMGTFGKTIKPVIVMEVATWTALCAKHPGLATELFEVGS